jgi:glutathione S-transferase
MPTYRLHYFPESGNSYKLALMLTLCGQSFDPVWTDFAGGVTRTSQCCNVSRHCRAGVRPTICCRGSA